jgi:hypothetical protein
VRKVTGGENERATTEANGEQQQAGAAGGGAAATKGTKCKDGRVDCEKHEGRGTFQRVTTDMGPLI